MNGKMKNTTTNDGESWVASIRELKFVLIQSHYFWKEGDFTKYLFKPTDPSSLAVFRICYGMLMMLDIPQERGLSMADVKWGNPDICHFPLIHSLSPLPYNWMCILYLIMWLGTVGIMLGYRFHFSCLVFLIPYWYIVLLEKSDWNNHTYMFGLIALLLFSTNANACWSVDKFLQNTEEDTVPYWNYFILRFQVFILYFMAGVKKMNLDWLCGYSMRYLSRHWVFDPFRLFLTNEQIDLWIIHDFAFLLDLFAGFGLYWSTARPMTLIFLFFFHFMNSRMFTIGMFPYMGIATMFIFCEPDWPKSLLRTINLIKDKTTKANKNYKTEISNFRKYLTMSLITLHMTIQFFLPFSHFITKGYNGWSNGLYGYSWDMMVNSWDTSMIVIKVIDNNRGGDVFYLNSDNWVLNEKWTRHPDMLKQFAKCAKRNLQKKMPLLQNISLHVDIWCSLNGRFHQRMFDPRTDLLTADWSPFREVSWKMPLLTKLSDWRKKLQKIEEEIHQSSNYTGVTFFADFPGFQLENFVNESLVNVTLTVLKGRVKIVLENSTSSILNEGESALLPSNAFHEIHSIYNTPSCYMYSYFNKTSLDLKNNTEKHTPESFLQDVKRYVYKVQRAIYLITVAILSITEDFLSTVEENT